MQCACFLNTKDQALH